MAKIGVIFVYMFCTNLEFVQTCDWQAWISICLAGKPKIVEAHFRLKEK